MLAVRPLVWMGTVSYGAYLWHFPVYLELDAARTGLVGLPLLAVAGRRHLRPGCASYYLVERPVMEGTFWRSLTATARGGRAMGTTVVVVVAATAVPAAATDLRSPPAVT